MIRIGNGARAALPVTVLGSLLASACAFEAIDEEPASGEVEKKVEALTESQYDAQVAAAIEMKISLGYPLAINMLMAVACDVDGNLRVRLRDGAAWAAWTTVDTGCRGVPTVGKWPGLPGQSDAVFVYTRKADNHLWEIYWPDVSAFASRYWNDVSAAAGTGPITGSPVLADSAGDPRYYVIVTVRKPLTNEILAVTWDDGGWQAMSTYIYTTNSIAARGGSRIHGAGPGWFASYISGLGLSSSDTSTGWAATLSRSFDSYRHDQDFDIQPAATPFVAVDPYAGEFDYDYYVARFGHDLKYRQILVSGELTGSWTAFPNCALWGRPISATMVAPGSGFYGFARGGTDGSQTNDLLHWGWDGCYSLGGTLYSTATPVEHGTSANFQHSALYKGPSSKLYYYDGETGQHTNLGLTLP